MTYEGSERMKICSGNFSDDFWKLFSCFSLTVFAFASAGSALQALGAAEMAGRGRSTKASVTERARQ